MLFTLASCDADTRAASAPRSATTQEAAIEKDAASIEGGVRLAAANKRLEQLEAEVENLKTNPQSIELGLLKQRLEAVEKVVYSRDTDRPDADDTTTSGPNRKSQPQSKASRVATKAEADAFTKGGN